MFLMIILGATDRRAPQGFAPIPIGLGLTLIHLIGIPVTNLSVNPARSTGPAIFVGGWAVEQLWLFWLAPIVGAAIAGLVYPMISGEREPEAAVKAAEANVIRRREETAATRSLLNTAKVMEDNPIALRLKELETLERVAERIDKISVFGGLDQVLNGLVKLR